MTISRQLKVACIVAVVSAFTATGCPSGQGGNGNPSTGASIGGPGSSQSGSMGAAGGAASGGAGGAAAGGAGGGH